MNGKLYLITISGGHPLVIRETVNAAGHAEWEIVRNATEKDILDVPKHPYFTSGMVRAA